MDGIVESPIEVYLGDSGLYKGDEGVVVSEADPVLTVLIPVMNVSDSRRDDGYSSIGRGGRKNSTYLKI